MRLAILAGSSVAVVLVAWAGCSADPDTSPTGSGGEGGAAVASSSTGAPTSGAGGVSPCDGPADGICDPGVEDCGCADCKPTGLCTPGACVTSDEGACDAALDSCVCADCDLDFGCGDPSQQNCDDDGDCDPYAEGWMIALRVGSPSDLDGLLSSADYRSHIGE